jgi:signal peptidase
METINKKKVNWKLIGNIAFWVVLAFVFIYAVLALFTKKDVNQSTLFGVSTLSVQTDSMKPTFESGDLIFVDTTFDYTELEIDDVITYKTMIEVDGEEYLAYNSHRIISINIVDGVYWYTTDGDDPRAVEELVVQEDIYGVWTGKKMANFGTFTDKFVGFIKSPIGFFLFIVLPCFAFLAYEVIRFVKVMSDYNVQKALGDRDQLQAEAVATAKAQIEAEMKAKAAESNKTE